ncbi:hypothetical protein A7K69_09800 [Parageobacillus thermoglucosidasius]|uniref:Uncharacterized protein n=1 Tax=Parageobacillus thermoglucosidasius TaxID=1426 RepID=A0A1B7KQR0_PARTM|nr:hypothetical protein A7K69_09800 [Parageobacillus thermoglucosidasius]
MVSTVIFGDDAKFSWILWEKEGSHRSCPLTKLLDVQEKREQNEGCSAFGFRRSEFAGFRDKISFGPANFTRHQ